MKKAFFAIFPLVLATACSDDFKPNGGGDEDGGVKFSAKLESNTESRTIYQEREGDAFPIFWSANDTVLLASPECGVKTATYVIEGTGSSTATSMTKVGAAGIQWGSAKSASFYSIYPKSYTMNGRLYTNKLTIDQNSNAVAEINVRKYQMNHFEKNADGVWIGTSIDDDPIAGEKCSYPDAIMYAQRYMSEQGTVEMQYHPFTTAFHIELDGYHWTGALVNNPANTPVTIESITIEAPEGTVICGKFTATFNDAASNEAPTVDVPSEQEILEPNIITVIPTVGTEDRLIDVLQGEKLSFNVFAIPNPDVVSAADWNVTVKTTNGTYKRKLVAQAAGANATLTAGMIHPVRFPSFYVETEAEFNINTWMANVPRNVYINELSIPGAWYSRQPEYQGTTSGMNTTTANRFTIQQLWDAGVRAFSVETRVSSVLNGIHWTPNTVVVSGSGSNTSLGTNAYRNGTAITEVINDLATAVSSKQYGYAVLALQYADGGEGGHRAEDYNFWLRGIANFFNGTTAGLTDLAKATVYDQPLTPQTTIGDVTGKLIILVNVASGLPGTGNQKYISLGDFTGAQAPAMYSFINKNRTAGTSPIVAMHHTWADSYLNQYAITNFNDQDNIQSVTNALMGLDPNTLYLNYAIANRTYDTDADNVDVNTPVADRTDGMPTYVSRKRAVKRMLRNSNVLKANGRHNLMLFVGAGGNEATSTSSNTNQTTAHNFAKVMNPWLLTQVYNEINNETFSPFGMVFCNFIAQTQMPLDNAYTYPEGSNKAGQSTTSFDNSELVEALVKMNRLFYLSRDPSKPEWNTTSQQNSKASYSSTHNDGGDAWTIE